MLTTAWEYLNSDPVLHAGMLTLLDRDETRLLYAAGDGVLLQWDDLYALSTATEELALRLFPLLDGKGQLMLHQRYIYDLLLRRYRPMMECYNYVYQKGGPLPTSLPEGFSLRPLAAADLGFVLANYAQITDPDYIRGRIAEGMIGAFFGNEPAGFIGVHDEGSIGLLEVLPPYRRHGLATALESAMINLRLSQGRIPFGQVVVSNTASHALQRKLGMTRSDTSIFWLLGD